MHTFGLLMKLKSHRVISINVYRFIIIEIRTHSRSHLATHQPTIFNCYSSLKSTSASIERNRIKYWGACKYCITHTHTLMDSKFELLKSPLRYEVIKSDWHKILLCSPEFNSQSIVYYFNNDNKKKRTKRTMHQDLPERNSQRINPTFQIKFPLYWNLGK